MRYLGLSKGHFENLAGDVLGEHDGLAYYTIGQRKGLKFGGEGEAWYVMDKDISRNVVIIDRGKDHPALFALSLIASELAWITHHPPADAFRCTAKIRYRQQDQPCRVTLTEHGEAHVVFDTPQRAITPGQAVVFYKEDRCLGGGKIKTKLS